MDFDWPDAVKTNVSLQVGWMMNCGSRLDLIVPDVVCISERETNNKTFILPKPIKKS